MHELFGTSAPQRPAWVEWLLNDSLPAVGVKLLFGYRPTFSGRGTRRELLITIVLVIAFALYIAMMGRLLEPPLSVRLEYSAPAKILFFLESVIIILPLVSAAVRRLHDVNRSGWALLFALFPYVGPIVLSAFMLWPGNREENAFGPNPRPPAKDKV